MLLSRLQAVEGVVYLLKALEMMRRVLSVRWRLWSFRNLLEALEVPLVRCVLLCMLEVVEFSKFAGGVGGAGGDAPCARSGTLYAGGCGR